MRLISWLKISFTWLFCGGRKFASKTIKECQSIQELRNERERMWKVIGANYKHWAARDFQRIYHKRQMEIFYGW